MTSVGEIVLEYRDSYDGDEDGDFLGFETSVSSKLCIVRMMNPSGEEWAMSWMGVYENPFYDAMQIH
ncbi:hypothetical protein PV326_007671, partial [Microctonus aethiopoides]